MPYATVQNVLDLAPQLTLTASSKPSEAQVESMLDETSKELDSVLSNLGYTPPVTHAIDVTIVRDMVANKVLAKVLRARTFGVGDVNQSGAKDADAFYDTRLKWLQDPSHPFELHNTTRTGSAPAKPGGLVRGFRPDDDIVGEGARVTVGKVF